MSRTPSQPGGTPGPGGKPAQSVGKPSQPVPHPHGPARPAAAPAATGAAPPNAGPANASPPAKSTSGPAALATRRNLIIGGAAAGVVLLVALFAWRPWAPTPPRLNEDPAVIARWAASSKLHRLPFDQQRQYMELIDEKDKRVEEAYEQGLLSDQEFRRALQLGWYGEHLKKMDNFFSKAPTLRALYLDKQVDKKIRKKRKQKDGPKPDEKSALTADEIDRDDSTEEQDINRWPADVRQRWTDYRNAYASRKQYWKDYAREQKAAQEANKGAVTEDEAGKNDPASGAEAAAPTDRPGDQ